jgi:hypothetical protein
VNERERGREEERVNPRGARGLSLQCMGIRSMVTRPGTPYPVVPVPGCPTTVVGQKRG